MTEERGIPLRAIGTWLLVMLAAATILKAADYLPAMLSGVSPRVELYSSIDEAERSVGARIWVPGYYPEDLQWPPARIEVSFEGPVSVALRVLDRRSGAPRLLVVQSIGSPAAPPPTLLPPGEQMEATEVALGRRRAVLARVLVGTTELHDIWWDQGERRITLRYSGPVERMLLMAASLERMHQ